MRKTPFDKCVYVVPLEGMWKIEVDIPYVPSLLTSNRDYYSEAEARVDAIHLEAKLNRMVQVWNRKRAETR